MRNSFNHLHIRAGSSLSRKYSVKPILYIPEGCKIFAFGTPSETKDPLIRDLGWSVEQGEAWAVVSGSGGGKRVIFKTLLGQTRIHPPSEIQGHWTKNGGLYPFLAASSDDPYTKIAHVSFRQRSMADSGAFFDYTSRYGAVREEEDRVTLREILCPSGEELTLERRILFEKLVEDMGLSPLLNLPMVTLSNGQTRRARILKAILHKPALLLLDEPLTGLDPPSREKLNTVLQELHRQSSPRIILGLRRGEEIPNWISHVLEIHGSTAVSRKNDSPLPPNRIVGQKIESKLPRASDTKPIVDLKNVNVSYEDRCILRNINWKIRQGERWHLRGSNGSGKTTLLSLLTGDHPQSYVQDHFLLPSISFSPDQGLLLPRTKIPTAHLRRLVGTVSPELFDAFPRRHPGMSVWEAITTGFDGGFVARTHDAPASDRKKGGLDWVDVSDEETELPLSSTLLSKASEKGEIKEIIRQWRISRCWEVLRCLGPSSWEQAESLPHITESTRIFAALPFSSLSPGEQRLVLLMRALVGRPPLVLLDETWSGMDDNMITSVRRYLRGEAMSTDFRGNVISVHGVDHTQAVVVVTHWEEEVPWVGDEVQVFEL